MVILSFCGKIGSGKTASANIVSRLIMNDYIERNLIGIMHLPSLQHCMDSVPVISSVIRVERESFASPIRAGVSATFGISPYDLHAGKNDKVNDYYLKDIYSNRDLMIAFAESLREKIGLDVFAQIMNKRILSAKNKGIHKLFMIDDLRKDVEFDMLASHDNSYTVWVEKEGNDNDYDGEILREECDYEIDWSTPEELESSLLHILKNVDIL